MSDAELIEIWKGSSGTRPQTLARLTDQGRDRFNEYLSVLERVVSDAQAKKSKATDGPGWTSGDWSPA